MITRQLRTTLASSLAAFSLAAGLYARQPISEIAGNLGKHPAELRLPPLIQIAAGNVDVARHLFKRPIRDDEAKAARVGRDPADDEVHPVGQAVTVPAGLHQLAVGHQLPEQALESRALLTRKLEPLEQLTRGGGVVYLFANQLEELFLVEHT